MKVNFYLDVGELTRKTLANRPKTLANESLAKRPHFVRIGLEISLVSVLRAAKCV